LHRQGRLDSYKQALAIRRARSVNMMISLAFVAPDIVEAAAAGRLPRGIGVTRLVDLSLSSVEQKTALGLPAKF
jgi:site-specific DNA recombinase